MREVLLKFQVDVSGTVTSAKLRLYSHDDTSDGPEVYTTQTNWSEASVTWNSRPARSSAVLADAPAVARSTWVELDVTAAVKGSGVVSFALVPDSGNGLSVHSSESASTSLRPQLVITTDEGTPPPPPPPSGTGTVTVLADADSFVEAASPTRNHGTATTLLVDGDPRMESYLRFSVSGVTGTVSSAKLRLWVTNETSNGPQVFKVPTTWTESGLNWSNKPAPIGGALADLGAIAAGAWVEIDVTAAVTGDGAVAFSLVPMGSNGVDFLSGESADATRRPQLVITYGTSAPPPSTALVTIAADGDAYVDSSSPSRNHGLAATLLVDQAPSLETYVRFSVSGITRAIHSAKLRLWVTNSTSDGPRVFSTGLGWHETTLTWENRPPRVGSQLADLGAIAAGGWVEVDVTPVVRGDGLYSFGFIPASANGVDFVSRQASDASRRPQLVLQVDAGVCTQARVHRSTVFTGVTTYVSESDPYATFHGTTELKVDASPRTEAFLRFAFGLDTGEEYVGARLRVFAHERGDNGLLVYGTDPWSNAYDVTWNTRPRATLGPLDNAAPFAAGSWAELDVSSYVRNQSGQAWLGLHPATDGLLRFDSGHGEDPWAPWRHRPELALRVAETYVNRCGTGGETSQVRQERGPPGHDKAVARFTAPDGGFAIVWDQDDTDPWFVQSSKLTRFAPDLSEQWTRHLPGNAYIDRVAITSLGNVLVAGRYTGTPDLGGGALPATNSGLFLLKLSPAGAHTWSRGFTSTGRIIVSALGTGADGSLNVAGMAAEPLDLGSGPLTGTFVARFLWDAMHVWSFGGEQFPIEHVAVDSEGELILGGTVPASASFRGQDTGARVRESIFLTRIRAADASERWRKVIAPPTSPDDAPRLSLSALATGADGTIAFGGSGYGDFTFAGSNVPMGNLGSDFYESALGKLRNDGTELWALAFDSFDDDSVTALAVSNDGAVTAGGYARSVIDLGAGDLGGRGRQDFRYDQYAVRRSATGEHLWSRVIEEQARSEFNFPAFLPLQDGGGVFLVRLDMDAPAYFFEGGVYATNDHFDTVLIRVAP